MCLGRTLGLFTVAIAVLILVGHVCAGSIGGHDLFAGAGHTHDAHEGDGHDLSVCEATSGAAPTSVERAESTRVLTSSPVVVSIRGAAGRSSVAVSLSDGAERPPLFLLHAVLLI